MVYNFNNLRKNNYKVMINRIKHKDFIWIDIFKPTKKDIKYLDENFHFHSLILKELRTPSIRAHIDHWQDYLYFVYHTPEFENQIETSQPKEIDFLITKNCLITVHYQKISTLAEIFKGCKNNAKSLNFYMNNGPGELLYKILEELIQFSLRQLTHIGEKISRVEKAVFSDYLSEVEKVKKISYIKRDILNFQLISRPHQKLLQSLFLEGNKFFGKSFKIYFSGLEEDHLKVSSSLQNYRDIIESLETTNSNLINIKINDIMKIFTILAFVTFPLTLISSIFGMNTTNTPIVGHSHDFWSIIIIMSSIAVLMFIYFRHKKWI